MDSGKQEVCAGIQAISAAGDAFEQIRASTARVAEQTQEVSAASEQMSAGTEQVVRPIDIISQAADQTASGMENVNSLVEEQLASMEAIHASASTLSVMSVELRELVGKFKV